MNSEIEVERLLKNVTSWCHKYSNRGQCRVVLDHRITYKDAIQMGAKVKDPENTVQASHNFKHPFINIFIFGKNPFINIKYKIVFISL